MAKVFRPSNREAKILSKIESSKERAQRHAIEKVKGVVSATLKASGRDFVSKPVEQLELTYEGIAGDYHAGPTRLSGARELWYKRGIEMRNERQISILANDELADIAANMDLEKIQDF